jgi:hypothetical protein
MALSSSAKNRMLNLLGGDLDRVYLLKTTPTIDTAISGYSANYAGYTSSGARYVTMSWATASGGILTSANSASSTPIMFAIPSGTTLSCIAYENSATGNVIAYFTVSGSYTTSDGSYYISSETFNFA